MKLKSSLDLKNFNSVMKEYMTFSKRMPADAINTSLWFISRNATMTTKHSDKSKISTDLNQPSKVNPEAPLAAIIVNKQLGKQGLKGLTGSNMITAVNKLIKKRNSSINYIRSGWKNAIQILEQYLKSKGEFSFASRNSSLNFKPDSAVMKKQTPLTFGTARVARIEIQGRVWGEIENNVGSKNTITLDPIKEKGLQEAVNKEEASKRIYIERKLNQAAARFNR